MLLYIYIHCLPGAVALPSGPHRTNAAKMSGSSTQPTYPPSLFNEYTIAFEGSSVACILFGNPFKHPTPSFPLTFPHRRLSRHCRDELDPATKKEIQSPLVVLTRPAGAHHPVLCRLPLCRPRTKFSDLLHHRLIWSQRSLTLARRHRQRCIRPQHMGL